MWNINIQYVGKLQPPMDPKSYLAKLAFMQNSFPMYIHICIYTLVDTNTLCTSYKQPKENEENPSLNIV